MKELSWLQRMVYSWNHHTGATGCKDRYILIECLIKYSNRAVTPLY